MYKTHLCQCSQKVAQNEGGSSLTMNKALKVAITYCLHAYSAAEFVQCKVPISVKFRFFLALAEVVNK